MLNEMNLSKTKAKRAYMHVNVILTFDMPNADGETQEFCDLHLPISTKDTDAGEFIHAKLFKRIAKICGAYERNVNELVRISTASDWALYEETTKAQSLTALGHNCKWHFGTNRDDLDEWEKDLMLEYGFGTSADMGWLRTRDMDLYMEKFNKALALAKAA